MKTKEEIQAKEDLVPLKGVDHIAFLVGNAKQAAYFYQKAFGFDVVAYAGPETGVREYASYVLEQGKIRFTFTTALQPDHPFSEHVKKHGDGVHNVSFEVEDVEKIYQELLKRGAKPAMEPQVKKDEHGELKMAAVHTYGDTIHGLVERKNYKGVFAPGYVIYKKEGKQTGLKAIDHIVGNVELGKMNEWCDFYRDVFGFNILITFDDKDISTEYSALMSKVMQNGTGRIKLPINEPAPGRKKSQIEEYLDYYKGPGVQHIALLTGNILETVSALRENGVEFLSVPQSYYEELPKRVGKIDEDLREIAKLNILVDRDDEGYLLQIFTKPMQDRPTFFFEVIQRKGSRGFGKGNFKALFEAIEREQAKRGNL
jgi:4-hydroxyphenylpyruvate dioxygenase